MNETRRESGHRLFSLLHLPLPSERHLLTFPSATPRFLATTHPPQPNFHFRNHHCLLAPSCHGAAETSCVSPASTPWHCEIFCLVSTSPASCQWNVQRQQPRGGTFPAPHARKTLRLVVVFPACVSSWCSPASLTLYLLLRVVRKAPAKPGMYVRVCVCGVPHVDALVSHSRRPPLHAYSRGKRMSRFSTAHF